MFSYLIFVSSKAFRQEILLTPLFRRSLLLGQEFPHIYEIRKDKLRNQKPPLVLNPIYNLR